MGKKQRFKIHIWTWILLVCLPISVFGVDEVLTEIDSIPLADAEREWLAEHRDIRLGVDPGWPPYDFIGVSGNHRGMAADVLALLSERLGISFRLVSGLDWTHVLDAARAKELDIVSMLGETPERAEYLKFTVPIISTPFVIVTSKGFEPVANLGDMTNNRVAMVRDYSIVKLSQMAFPNLTVHTVESPLAGLQAVSSGKMDAYVGNLGVASYLIHQNGLVNLKIAAETGVTPQTFSIGVRSDWPEFVSILDKGLASISQEEMNAIHKKWVPIEMGVSPSTAATAVPYKRLVAYGIGVFLIVCLLAFILVRTLRKENVAVSFGSPWFRGLVLAGLSIFVVTVALLGWYNLERNKTQHLEDMDENLRGILSVSQDRFDLWLKERISLMSRLGRDPEVVAFTRDLLAVRPNKRALLASGALRKARFFFKNAAGIFPNIGFFIISPDHMSIGSMRDANMGTRNLISEQQPELLQRAFQGKVDFVPPMTSDVHLSRSTRSDKAGKPPTMFFIGPVQDADGRILAVMTLRVDPWEDFTRAMKSFETSRETYAFDRNGTMLSYSRFEEQLRRVGLLAEDQGSALNMEIRDPGGNMLQGYRPGIERSQQPLTHMATRAIALRQRMETAGIRHGHSPVESDIAGYRDYRGVPVFGAWLWNADIEIGLAVEVDVDEALAHFYRTRMTIFSILGFTLLLSVGAILFVLIVGERTSRALMRARDNLEGKVAERTEQLTVAEERSRLLLNSVGEGIFGVDLNGKVMFINAAANRLLGYESDELIGQKVHEKIHHSHADRSPYPVEDCPMARAFTHGTTETISDEMLWRKDGGGFSVEYTATPILRGKEITGAVIAFRDITERKQAEVAILHSEQRIDAAATGANIGIWEFFPLKGKIYCNETWATMKGYHPDELRETGDKWSLLTNGLERWAEMVHPDDLAATQQEIGRHLNGKTDIYKAELRYKRGDGEWMWILDVGKVFERNDAGEAVRMNGIHVDITEGKNMEKALASERERLQDILDTSPVGVAFSTKGKIHFANPRFLEMFGAGVGDASPNLYVNPEERDLLVGKLSADGKVENYDIKMYDRNRETRDMLITYRPISYDGEDGILGWLLDITDRKKVEQEIKEKYDELARFRKLAVGRETKMIKLKKEINELAALLGQGQKYKIVQ